ncbi:MAG TPA: hypothetical protein VEQ10_01655, partial [Vicinamibacteria bacterium]|nr:hypothetical protein [Vicinamibacteria bacterium]
LLGFVLLLLLRFLPRHEIPPPPGWPVPAAPRPQPRPGQDPPRLRSGPSLLVAAAALLLLAPAPAWRHAPGPRLAFQTTATRLLLWHDGPPLSAEPLLPLAPFGAHAPAMATLAADLSGLSGADPARAVLLVVVTAAGLTLVGLFALCATRLLPWVAAVTALAALAAAPWPAWLSAFGPGEALLALVFLLPATALLVGHASRSSAVAAGLLAAAGALAHPLLALLAGVFSGLVALRRGPGRRAAMRRLALGATVALLLAAPGLWPLAAALSRGELLALASPPPLRALSGLAVALAVVAAVPLLEPRVRRLRSRRLLRALVACLATLLLVLRVHGWIAAGQLPAATLASLAEAASATGPLDAICAPEGVRDWVPALAARPAGEPGPWIPAVYADAWAARRTIRCVAVVQTSR